MNETRVIKEASKCPYYGCAGTRICTYHPWTTHCPYPNCDKKDFLSGKSEYEALVISKNK